MFNLCLIGLVSTGAWPIPASWVGDVTGQDFAGDGGCGTLSISEHWLNLGERRFVAGFQKLAMSCHVHRCHRMVNFPSYKLLYNALHIKVSYTIVITLMSTNNDGFSPSWRCLSIGTQGAQHQLRQGGLWPAVDEEYGGSHFHRSKAPEAPGKKAWHGRWFIDGLLNIDGLLMVYSCLFFIGCLLIFIYIYWWFMIVFWCFLMFVVVYSQRRSDCWVSISGKPQRKPGTPDPGTCCWVAKLG